MRASPNKILHHTISIDTAAGADPDAIDDALQVYGDDVEQMFPEIDTPCDSELNPGDQCVYNALSPDHHDRCIYCLKRTG